MKHPCDQHCPDRNAECHAHCEKWLIYEKARNEEYIRRGKEKHKAMISDQIDIDRKERVATGKMKRSRNKTAFKRY